MIPYGAISLRNSPGAVYHGINKKCLLGHMKAPRRQQQRPVSMGPVVASLIAFVINRFVTRVLAGQLFRKGIPRKIRRMTKMMMEHAVITDVFFECLEDILNYFLCGM